jgi:hypothetical protein
VLLLFGGDFAVDMEADGGASALEFAQPDQLAVGGGFDHLDPAAERGVVDAPHCGKLEQPMPSSAFASSQSLPRSSA